MQRTGAIICMVCMYLIGGPMGLSHLMLTDPSVSGTFIWLHKHAFCRISATEPHPKVASNAIAFVITKQPVDFGQKQWTTSGIIKR